ncbi:B3 domain-containing protein [Canna indica]|uniref:B3 domain-containing protein n=1 Tax=Canna indica TaxID=4628 RepID=A0AAQ3L9E3_9LILI|nr:B3 domain-containing protein [Canna indica]
MDSNGELSFILDFCLSRITGSRSFRPPSSRCSSLIFQASCRPKPPSLTRLRLTQSHATANPPRSISAEGRAVTRIRVAPHLLFHGVVSRSWPRDEQPREATFHCTWEYIEKSASTFHCTWEGSHSRLSLNQAVGGDHKAPSRGSAKLAGHTHAEPTPTYQTPASAMQDGTVPLLGTPFFTFIIGKAQVGSPFHVFVPRPFFQHLPNATVPVMLSHENRTWGMKYYCKGLTRRLCSGWDKFATDNNLQVGDGCVLELVESENGAAKFRVQILRRQPLPLHGDPEGLTSNHPILID